MILLLGYIDSAQVGLGQATEHSRERMRTEAGADSMFASLEAADERTQRTLARYVRVRQVSFGQMQTGLVEVLKFLSKNGAELVDHALWQELDQMGHQLGSSDTESSFSSDSLAFKTASGLIFTLSASYVSWLIKSGSVAASMLSLTPLWTPFDPIPVLAQGRPEKPARRAPGPAPDDSQDAEVRQDPADTVVENLFAGNHESRPP